jgi:hypothetical protein
MNNALKGCLDGVLINETLQQLRNFQRFVFNVFDSSQNTFIFHYYFYVSNAIQIQVLRPEEY